jgi:hypothetical protein
MKNISWTTFSAIFGRDQAEPGDQVLVNNELFTVSSTDKEGVNFDVLTADDDEEE